MNEINRKFRKSRGFGFVETLNGYVFTPEANAHTFRIQCVVQEDNLETVVPFETGSVVSARFLKSDHVTELVEGSLDENGAAVVTLPAECYAVPGRFLLTILVAYNSISVCVYAATGTVIGAESGTVNLSQNASREIDEKIAELNAAAAQVNSAISAGSAKITEINQAAAAARASIPQDYTALSDSVGDLKSASCKNYEVLAKSAINNSGNTYYEGLSGNGEYDFQYYAEVKNNGSGNGYFTVVWYNGTNEVSRATQLISQDQSYTFTIPKGTTFTKIGVANTNSLSNCTIYVYGDSNSKLLAYAEQDVLSTLSLVSKTAFLPTLINGTVGNSSNVNGVATDKIYPFGDAKYVKVEINKDKQVSGNQYQIVYTTYSVDNGVTGVASQANRITADAYLPKSDTGIFSNEDGSVGFAFALFEWTSGDAYDPVRKTDFTDDDIVVTYIYERKTIEIGAGKDFEKFSDGLAEAYRLGNCDVIVYPGTYDLIVELGESGMTSSKNYKGLYIGRNMHLKFLEGAKVLCHYSGTIDTIFTWFAILRAMDGDFIVENADFDCSNIRYCVHDEKDGVGDYIHEYIDCRMKIDNTNGSTWGVHGCIGGGFGTHGIVKVIRGIYESVGIDSYDNSVITYHQPADASITDFENTLIVDGVYFVNGTTFFSCGGASTLMSDFVCKNCSMLVAPFVNGLGTSATQNVNGYIWNNEIRN